MAFLLQLGKGDCAWPVEEEPLEEPLLEVGGAGDVVVEGGGLTVVEGGGLEVVGGGDVTPVGGGDVTVLGGGADLGEFVGGDTAGEITGGDTEGAETGVVKVGRKGVGTVGRLAALVGVTALEAVKAVGTCRGILAENALVAMSMRVKRIDFITICMWSRDSLCRF